MTQLLAQYEQELKEVKATQKQLISSGKFGTPLQHINTKIAMLNQFINDLKWAIQQRQTLDYRY